jgi:hypothetical protein
MFGSTKGYHISNDTIKLLNKEGYETIGMQWGWFPIKHKEQFGTVWGTTNKNVGNMLLAISGTTMGSNKDQILTHTHTILQVSTNKGIFLMQMPAMNDITKY